MSQTTTPQTQSASHATPARRGGSAVVGAVLALAAVVTIALIVFIAQNSKSVEIRYLGANTSIGFGVALLLAAVAGAVIAALVGVVLRVRRTLRSR